MHIYVVRHLFLEIDCAKCHAFWQRHTLVYGETQKVIYNVEANRVTLSVLSREQNVE